VVGRGEEEKTLPFLIFLAKEKKSIRVTMKKKGGGDLRLF